MHRRTNSSRGSGSFIGDRIWSAGTGDETIWARAELPPKTKQARIAAEIRKNIQSPLGTFVVQPASAGRNNESLRCRCDRRTIIRERADARQTAIRRASQCGTSQDENQGENEAEGLHLTVSGLPAGAISRFVRS